MKLMLFAIVMCLVIAILALCWFHLVNSDAGDSSQARAVGGRGGPKRRSRSKSADGDVEAPADETGEADVEHLEKIVGWRNIAAVVGLGTVWMAPNPLTVAALSTWTYASWTMIGHHVCHGGYNRVDAGKFNSRGFALGLVNRCVDWLDWMQPEAWNIEHNRLHHYRLNEPSDPDLVQRNLDFLRDANVPLAAKYAAVSLFLPVWKWFYYAPNTYKVSSWSRSNIMAL